MEVVRRLENQLARSLDTGRHYLYYERDPMQNNVKEVDRVRDCLNALKLTNCNYNSGGVVFYRESIV